MSVDTVAGLAEALRHSRLLEPAQLDELAGNLQARFPEPRALARELVRRGWLTPFQVNQLFQGRGGELLLGSYVLLERLGEGGMGQVFKARNWKLRTTVALKLIRPDRLDSPDAVRRFRREVRAAAALSDPHVVRALDADEVAGTHFLVMEHVAGTDLARLVKQQGPLPVARACDYVRQAALGLQHAFERGLVHRDIKPHNLLLTADGSTVKILDLGLARLARTSAGAETTGTMTAEGTVMGTPDYIAPEQAVSAHEADIRADLYSLGCTLYFLLAGRVPFPGGSALEKLVRHRLEEPAPLEQLRPEVPPAVTAVLRKLMARRPEDRFQTPAELADALASLAGSSPAALPAAVGQPTTAPPGREQALSDTPFSLPGATLRLDRPRSAPADNSASRRRWVVGGTVAGVVALALLLLALVRPWGGGQTPRPGAHANSALTSAASALSGERPARPADEAWIKSVAALPADRQVRAVATKLTELNPGFDGEVTPTMSSGTITGLKLTTDDLTDLSPLRALPGLRELSCLGTRRQANSFADLRPLEGLALTHLSCPGNPRLADLTPLHGMPLVTLDCHDTAVADLAPLTGMSLQELDCVGAPVRDLVPLTGMPLRVLRCDFSPWRDLTVLHSLWALEQLNDEPAGPLLKKLDGERSAFETWRKQVEALPGEEQLRAVVAELQKRNPGYHGEVVSQEVKNGRLVMLTVCQPAVKDVAPLAAATHLHSLCLATCGVRDLWPLRELRLVYLNLDGTRVTSLEALRGMPLENLHFHGTRVRDLAPLAGMPLKVLVCRATPVTDLRVLAGLPLEELWADLNPQRDAALVRDIPTLRRINDRPLAEFWKKAAGPPP